MIPTKRERLKAYKIALETIERGRTIAGMTGNGLCLMLPCIWLKLDDYCDDFIDKKGNKFTYREVVKYFPEFGMYYPSTYPKNYRVTHYEIQQWRINTLKQCIYDVQRTTRTA